MRSWVKVIVVFIILVIVAFVFAIPFLMSARFTVINQSQESVQVVAYWREQEKWLGLLQPSSEREFSVNEEAAMKFTAHYPNGRMVESKEIYFTSGVSVIAEINETEIKLRYD